MSTKQNLCKAAVVTFTMAFALHLVAYSANTIADTASTMSDSSADMKNAKNLSIAASAFGWITFVLVLVCVFMPGSASVVPSVM